MEDYILELKSITKIFPGVKALDNVSFNLKKGEVHALMGENGAGKSTFIKIITGVHIPEHGSIYLDGQEVSFRTPLDSQAYGIAAIYQHATCYPDLTVAENVFMGHEIMKKPSIIDWKRMCENTEMLLRRLGAMFSPKKLMGSLSVAQQQIVEIAKALSTDARIIIMDEPTAALSKGESEELFKIIRQLREEGKSIIFISHRIDDIYRVADRVTVFRDAKYVGTWDIDQVNNEILIKAMVGREISNLFPKRTPKIGDEIFRIEGFSKVGMFKDISLSVKAGEVVGLAGLVGAGRSEVCQSVIGILPHDSGRVFLEGKEIYIKSPACAMKHGIAYLPEDRQLQGLILSWDIGKNITLPILERTSKNGWINKENEERIANEYFHELKIKANSIHDLVNSLSGGNQQKVIVAKLMALNVKVLILDEPTKGVDVGAKYAIYEIINSLVEDGFGILLISSEMQEIVSMCDRIFVMKDGRVSGCLSGGEITNENVLELAIVAK